ncbi:McrB family protein [Tenacibaculum aiptasiae]|uniref:McrB family protein n=1 Tax=Tenacibaculum aiptasiae TaxID=426481 RepID=UPI00232CF862|nr:AAA family ATPase [Tenacibaculum aiptasiae]
MQHTLEELKQKFLTEWPLERLQTMQLHEYTNTNREDSFCYWVEHVTRDLGSVVGGSSYKFGIYKKKSNNKTEKVNNHDSDDVYAWHTKYGTTAQKAFESIKHIITSIAVNAQENTIEVIDDIDLGTAYKWKIAFLYGDYNIVNIFKKESLKEIATYLNIENSKTTNISLLHRRILEKKETHQDYYGFTNELWQITSLNVEGIKKEFSDWLKGSETSNKTGSYLRAIDILNEILETDIYLKYGFEELQSLYNDLIKNQRNTKSKYYYEKAPSYGNNGFFSASIKAFTIFLKNKSMKKNEYQLETLVSEFKKYLEGYADFTINVYSQNFNFYIKRYLNKTYKSVLDKDDFEELSNVTYSQYERRTYESFEHKGKGHVHFVEFFESKLENIYNQKKGNSKNLILYGPPGTGKTYQTKKLAIELIENCEYSDEKEARKYILERYNELCKKEQIVFTTFHQSMGYEDFVEGIKPKTEDKKLTYEVEDGIFKNIVTKASYSLAKEVKKESIIRIKDFSTAYDVYLDEVSEKLETEEKVTLQTKSGGTINIVEISQQGNFLLEHENGERRYTVSKDRLLKLNKGIPDYKEVLNINEEFRKVIGGSNASAYWAVLRKLQELNIVSKENDINDDISYEEKVEVISSLTEKDYIRGTGDHYVLIIDEVNRGNVSAIFGELITLLEPDKRLGKDEAITVKLPYSKKEFGIPSNLHIIGTMNTADRSVEALDTALRRRFEFKEIMPKPELLKDILFDGFNLKEVLETINNRIELLLDRDHTIGHSYFINVESGDTEELASIFNNKVIPLLQEYFYGDYGKIGMVLGQGFIKKKDNGAVKFANFKCDNSNDYLISSFQLQKIASENISKALYGTLNKEKIENLTELVPEQVN